MFNFFRKKLKDTVSKISKEIDEKAEGREEIVEVKEPEEKAEEKKGFFTKLKEKFLKREEKLEENIEKEVVTKEEIEIAEKKINEENKSEKKKETPKQEETFVTEEKKEEKKYDIKPEIKIEEHHISQKPHETHMGKEKHLREELKNLAKTKEFGKPTEVKKKTLLESEIPIKTKEPKEGLEKEREPEKANEAQKKLDIQEMPEEVTEEEPKKKGFFNAIKEKIITKKINESQFEDIFWNLELVLMENNVAVEVISKIKEDLKNDIVEKSIIRNKIEKTIEDSLKNSIRDLFKKEKFDFLTKIREKKPFVICFFGINGSGKTTSIAKIAKLIKNNKLSCVLAASDTFRAASIEQLQMHANKLGIKMIKHDYGSDPAAVAYDAIEHAKSKNIDVVLIDTAGRMHSNVNLSDEMKKIVRVSKPDLKIFVGEAITGNDCIEQAKTFNEAIGIDAIILAKADIDEKGGAAVSVSYVTGKPIIYLGTGQEYDDLQKFDSDVILSNLGLT